MIWTRGGFTASDEVAILRRQQLELEHAKQSLHPKLEKLPHVHVVINLALQNFFWGHFAISCIKLIYEDCLRFDRKAIKFLLLLKAIQKSIINKVNSWNSKPLMHGVRLQLVALHAYSSTSSCIFFFFRSFEMNAIFSFLWSNMCFKL